MIFFFTLLTSFQLIKFVVWCGSLYLVHDLVSFWGTLPVPFFLSEVHLNLRYALLCLCVSAHKCECPVCHSKHYSGLVPFLYIDQHRMAKIACDCFSRLGINTIRKRVLHFFSILIVKSYKPFYCNSVFQCTVCCQLALSVQICFNLT